MPTLSDYITNKSQYPDETTITLQDGSASTLGEIRKGYMMEADYRRKTSDLSTQRRDFDRERTEWEGARLDAEAKLTDLAKSLIANNPQVQTRDELQELIEDDPRTKKLMEQLKSMEGKLGEVEKRAVAAEQRQGLYERTYIADQHQRVLTGLKREDPDLDVEGLIGFAKERYIPRLDDAYRLFTEEKRMTKAVDAAKETARKEAYEKAKAELVQPVISPRRTLLSPAKPDAPKTFDEARDAALQDPEIVKLLTSDGNGY